ncbi:MAG: hypothetical protein JWN41_1682 [Thermoleophilia bacterium]|nr:hypothetical protein [Thermoleophilia bacterium]
MRIRIHRVGRRGNMEKIQSMIRRTISALPILGLQSRIGITADVQRARARVAPSKEHTHD